jgi:hypothetical protein
MSFIFPLVNENLRCLARNLMWITGKLVPLLVQSTLANIQYKARLVYIASRSRVPGDRRSTVSTIAFINTSWLLRRSMITYDNTKLRTKRETRARLALAAVGTRTCVDSACVSVATVDVQACYRSTQPNTRFERGAFDIACS